VMNMNIVVLWNVTPCSLLRGATDDPSIFIRYEFITDYTVSQPRIEQSSGY
jgi:hypothetical protein